MGILYLQNVKKKNEKNVALISFSKLSVFTNSQHQLVLRTKNNNYNH